MTRITSRRVFLSIDEFPPLTSIPNGNVRIHKRDVSAQKARFIARVALKERRFFIYPSTSVVFKTRDFNLLVLEVLSRKEWLDIQNLKTHMPNEHDLVEFKNGDRIIIPEIRTFIGSSVRYVGRPDAMFSFYEFWVIA